MTAGIAWVLERTIGFRVHEDDEASGVDLVLHAETAYDLHVTGSGGRPHFGGGSHLS
jgi:Amt family ammonium transporter